MESAGELPGIRPTIYNGYIIAYTRMFVTAQTRHLFWKLLEIATENFKENGGNAWQPAADVV